MGLILLKFSMWARTPDVRDIDKNKLSWNYCIKKLIKFLNPN